MIFLTEISSTKISNCFCYVFTFIMYFTAQCTLVQSAVLRSHVVCLSVCLSVRPSVRPSVCLSVTLVDCDHMGWKSRKLIARTISPTPSLFAAKRRSTYSEGNMGKFWGRLEVG